jgi:di/tricarboxylate transporter
MSLQIIVLLGIVGVAIVLFLSEKLRPDLIAMLVMLSLGLSGILTARETFSGLSNPSVILIIAVFIVTGGLFRGGVSALIGRWLLRMAGKDERRLAALAVLAAAGLSLFMNNIASAAVVMPAVMDATQRSRISPSKVLLPMAMATQLAGMATLFTTANIVASGVLINAGLPGFGLFDFLAVGGSAALAGLAFLLLVGPRLLPDRRLESTLEREDRDRSQLARHYQLGERLQAVQLEPDSPLRGLTLVQAGMRERLGASVMAIQRRGQTMATPGPGERLRAGDVLLLETRPLTAEALDSLGLAATPVEAWDNRLARAGRNLVEVLVAPRSAYLGRTLKEMQFRSRYGLAVVGLLQGDRIYRAAAADVRLQGGEALLMYGPPERLDILRGEPDWIVLNVSREVTQRPRKMTIALLVLAATLVVSALGVWPVAHVFFAGALVMVLAGCLTMDEAYQAIEWRSVFLVGAMLPVGLALSKTGAARWLGGHLITATGPFGPLATMAGLFLVSMALNQFVPGGSAVPAVLVPIAIAAAQGLGADPRAFALVVAVSTGTSLLTPFAHPVNVLVMGPGGYSARDYVRLGLPLVATTFVATLIAVRLFWHV